ncbi:hypothetical protein BKH40_04385 [Helicobacter sp. 11S02629-2]|nr:glycosyltransferase family A protein [Helicobacter sp. 11S02629-2]PAF44929.1 hypothetical protein BKH40_04385 [Helicobacter sp. 11S02629-2]
MIDNTKDLEGEEGLVSIIIPVYNVEKYLKTALDSVLNQSYEKLDIILVVDGSTDKSLDIALEYAKKDRRIFIVEKLNGGLSTARNLGTELVKNSPLRKALESIKEDSNKGTKNALLTSNYIKPKQIAMCAYPYSLKYAKLQGYLYPSAKNYFVNAIFPFKSQVFGEKPIFIGSFSKNELKKRARLFDAFKKQNLHRLLNLTPKVVDDSLLSHFEYDKRGFFRFSLNDITQLLRQDLPPKQFIHYFDSDDFMQRLCIQSCINAMEKDTEVVVHHYSIFYDGVGVPLPPRTKEQKKWHAKHHKPHYIENVLKEYEDGRVDGSKLFKAANISPINFGWHGMVSNSYLNKIALRFTPFLDMEDLNFGMLLLGKAKAIKVLKDKLVAYRVRKDSISNYAREKKINIPQSLEYLKSHFKSNQNIRTYFNLFCHFFAVLDIYLSLKRLNSLDKKAKKSLETQLTYILQERVEMAFYYDRKGKDPLKCLLIVQHLPFLMGNKVLDSNTRMLLRLGMKNGSFVIKLLNFAFLSVNTTFWRRTAYIVARSIYIAIGLKKLRMRLAKKADIKEIKKNLNSKKP